MVGGPPLRAPIRVQASQMGAIVPAFLPFGGFLAGRRNPPAVELLGEA
jgi:hypothetical protein